MEMALGLGLPPDLPDLVGTACSRLVAPLLFLILAVTLLHILGFYQTKREDPGEGDPNQSTFQPSRLLAVNLFLRTCGWSAQNDSTGDTPLCATTSGETEEEEEEEVPRNLLTRPHLRGTFQPSHGLVVSNNDEAQLFENENCSGHFLILHRPTFDKKLEKSCKYPYAYHFATRKRLWEARIQIRFKHTLKDPLLFGAQLNSYVPLSGTTKRFMGITVGVLRKAVGSSLYHSVGDDPNITPAPHELPVFAMPLWAFDQFIVTPEGEEPPNLTDPRIPEMGHRRTTDRAEFIRNITELQLEAGPTYTFCFWGISQFVDQIQWHVRGIVPGWPLDFNLFCGKPPIHIVLYTLRPSPPDESGAQEQRHLESRKAYCLSCAFWSSLHPPSREVELELFATAAGEQTLAKPKASRGRFQSIFGQCCLQR